MLDNLEKSFDLFSKGWALVTAGSIENYNTMTIAWGSLGTLWSTPIANVYVKNNRYTHQFMERNEYFTVSFYSNDYKKDLSLLGTMSGKDLDKVALTSLEPVQIKNSVTFKQASVTLLCKKIYAQDFNLEEVPQFAKDKYYQVDPVHTMYVGEVIDIIK